MYAYRGNALFLILIAVALFAGLSYAVTRSSRGGGTIEREQALIRSAELSSHFAQLTQTAARMIAGGLTVEQLNFTQFGDHTGVFGSIDHTLCVEEYCRIFRPAGGNVVPINGNPVYRHSGATLGAPYLYYTPLAGIGSPSADIVYAVNGANWDICQEINRANGVPAMPYNFVPPDPNTTLPYVYAAAPFSPIVDTAVITPPATTSGEVPRTFCYCPQGTKALCLAHGFHPVIMHVVVER